jgi:hypothetical protein
VARSDFEATWVPRIGEEAATELRHLRKVITITVLPAFALAGASSFAFAGGPLDKLLGVVLLAGAMVYPVELVRGQKRLAEAMSYWFGVRIKIPPPMSVRSFDTWREKRGLRPPDGRADRPIGKVPLESMTLISLSLPAPPKLWPGEQMLWSGIGYTSQPKGWHEGTLYVTSGRVMFAPARISPFPINPPEVQRFQLSDFLSVKLEDQGPATPDAGRERQRLEFTFRGGQLLLVAVDKPDEVLGELRALLPIGQGV